MNERMNERMNLICSNSLVSVTPKRVISVNEQDTHGGQVQVRSSGCLGLSGRMCITGSIYRGGAHHPVRAPSNQQETSSLTAEFFLFWLPFTPTLPYAHPISASIMHHLKNKLCHCLLLFPSFYFSRISQKHLKIPLLPSEFNKRDALSN